MVPQNMIQVLQAHFRDSPERPCLRSCRDGAWRDLSYGEVGARVEAIAGGLVALGLEPGDRAAILSRNRAEWALCDLGTFFAGGVVATIFPDLTAEEAAYILSHSEARLVFVEDTQQLDKVRSVWKDLPQLGYAVLLEPSAPGGDPRVLSLGDLERRSDPAAARKRIAWCEMAPPSTPLTLVYTSGTTGQPKGVIITHGNVAGVTRAVMEAIGGENLFHLNLSFLPLAHMLERIGGHFMPLVLGGTIAYARSMETIAQDFLEVKPEFAIGVPRFFEKIYDRIQAELRKAPRWKQALFRRALDAGSERSRKIEQGEKIPARLALRFALYDALVFSKVRRKLGGRLRYLVSGGAPLAGDLARFFHCSGILICEGYGATETSAPATLNVPSAFRFGSVGKPLPGVEVKIVKDGEILVKGPNVCAGYFKDPETTEASFSEDGFYRTGDVGFFDADGFLAITDRMKELIITASGKNIAPTKLENLLKARPAISNALAHCDRRPYLVALLTLDRPGLQAVRPELAGAPVEDPRLQAYLQEQVDAVNARLPRYEQIKRFHVIEEDFTAERGEMTLTFKLKRRIIEQRYRALLDNMYEGHTGRDAVL